MQVGYKVKLYPNPSQEQVMIRHLGACRFVYNHFLALKKQTYLETGRNLTYNQMSKLLTQLRKDTSWMQEIRIVPLQQSLRQLDVAYNRFFRKESMFPRFKKRGSGNSFKKVIDWTIQGSKIRIMRGLEVRYRGDFIYGKTLTISQDSDGTWWAATSIDKKIEPQNMNGSIGVDLGINTLITTSDGKKYDNARPLNGTLERIKSASKHLSKKKKGSKRREKARLELAKLHRKVHFIRTNHLHHVSKAIVSKNHAVIALENLAVANMMKNRRLSHSISDASWGELIRQITYKQERRGGKVVKIDRFFPSSKTCSVCDFVVDSLPLSVRNWTCGKCGTEHDRDINAAKMIKKQAAVLLGVEKKALPRKRQLTSMNRGGSH